MIEIELKFDSPHEVHKGQVYWRTVDKDMIKLAPRFYRATILPNGKPDMENVTTTRPGYSSMRWEPSAYNPKEMADRIASGKHMVKSTYAEYQEWCKRKKVEVMP